MAVCYINLNDYDKALATLPQARTYCERHEMPLLVVQADYNVAYLHYLRGEYTRALELYRAARTLRADGGRLSQRALRSRPVGNVPELNLTTKQASSRRAL